MILSNRFIKVSRYPWSHANDIYWNTEQKYGIYFLQSDFYCLIRKINNEATYENDNKSKTI